MINKTKFNEVLEYSTHWLLSLLLVSLIIQNICCKAVYGTDNNKQSNSGSLPKIVTLQTYRDWSSRLGAANHTTPHSAALVFQESKDVRTTYDGPNDMPLTSTQQTINEMRESLFTTPRTENITKMSDTSAHTIAAQVLSRILHISPLLALASSGAPNHRPPGYNITAYELKRKNKFIRKLPLIESMNEIDTESNDDQIKSERKIGSGISFASMPSIPTTTDMSAVLYDSTPTDTPADYPSEYPLSDEEQPQEGPEGQEEPSEEEEPAPPEDPEDYEDDEELESFRYPVTVTFQDSDEDNGPEQERERENHPPPFLIPNIDLNPEALKQKGCRTVVKEVQAIPVENRLEKHSPNPKNGITRRKRSDDPNARKFTSIVMTKECHFPGDEGASSEHNPQTVSTMNPMSDSKTDLTYYTPTPPKFDEEDDEDFDFSPRITYPSSELMDTLEPKPSTDKKSYADNPIFRRNNDEYSPPKADFDFDDTNYFDFNDRSKPNRRTGMQSSPKRREKSRRHMSASPYEYDDEGFGPTPRPKSKRQNMRSGQKRPQDRPMLRNDRQQRGGKRKKPKKVNRSFAFFRRAEPKEKDPNESDYSVSYGRGNFQSFSDSYDSDKDGPRRPGMRRSVKYE